MKTLELKVYEIFKNKLGQEEAETIIQYFGTTAENKYEEKKDFLATKDDIGQLRKETAEAKADLIKWMFIFWIGQIVATFGFIILYLKK